MAQFSRRNMAARKQLILIGLAAASCLCIFLFPFFTFSALGYRYSQGALQYAINVQPVFLVPLVLSVLMLAASFTSAMNLRLGAAGAYMLSLLVIGMSLRRLIFGGDVQWLLLQATELLDQVGLGGVSRSVLEATLSNFLRLDYGYYLAFILAAGFAAVTVMLPEYAGRGAARLSAPAGMVSATGTRPWDRPKGGHR